MVSNNNPGQNKIIKHTKLESGGKKKIKKALNG